MAATTFTKTGAARVVGCGTLLQSRYRILRSLGRGGMGEVYEAVDLRLGHSVAIKQSLKQDDDHCAQFEREARLMAQLDHPALPRVIDYFIENDGAFLVMQFVEGHDLATLLAQRGPIPERLVTAWADQLLDSLTYLHLHDRQIVHRDIKPRNVRVTEGGRIVLLDFGLAKSRGEKNEDEESDRSIFGYSPRYAPLEQMQDCGTTPQSDIYALGATLYHLLTNVKPPDALIRAAVSIVHPDPLRPAHELNQAVSPELSEILNRAMAQDPDARYASAAAFRQALSLLGRRESAPETEIAYGSGSLNTATDESGDITFVACGRGETWFLGSRAMVAVLLLVLAAFGVFCRYYPWEMPDVNHTKPHPERHSSQTQIGLHQLANGPS